MSAPFAPYNKMPVQSFTVPRVGENERPVAVVGADWLTRELGKIEGTLAPWTQFGRNFVTPLMFGGKPGGPDASAAINKALATGYPLDLLGLDWYCNNITSDVDLQMVYSSHGFARVFKNANGDLWTMSGDNVRLYNVGFRGDASTPVYTGHNLVLTGDYPYVSGCGSRYAYGRALYASGQGVQVYGSGDIWQTADATASGYDIELNGEGTNTGYHQLHGIVSTQNTGGILQIDTGDCEIIGGQTGKLTWTVGTAVAGINMGSVIGMRVLNTVLVSVSTGGFSKCHFGANGDVTFDTGTSGLSLDESNQCDTGCVLTNNGNKNNVMIRQVSTGSTMQLRYGDDASLATLDFDPAGTVTGSQFKVPNNKSYLLGDTAGTGNAGSLVAAVTSDNVALSSLTAGKALILAATATGAVADTIGGTVKTLTDTSGFHIGTSASAPFLSSGTGTPEGVVAAPVGSLFMRTDGGAGTSLYVKESGSGNTGWVGK